MTVHSWPDNECTVTEIIVVLDPVIDGPRHKVWAAWTQHAAVARHRDAEAGAQHEAMGFTNGWGKALDHLIECAKTMP